IEGHPSESNGDKGIPFKESHEGNPKKGSVLPQISNEVQENKKQTHRLFPIEALKIQEQLTSEIQSLRDELGYSSINDEEKKVLRERIAAKRERLKDCTNVIEGRDQNYRGHLLQGADVQRKPKRNEYVPGAGPL